MKKVAAFLMKPFLKIPALRRRYLRKMLEYIEETPRNKLPEELRPVQAMLMRLPKHQRMAALQAGVEAGQQGQQIPQSRQLRRAAARQQRRNR